MQPWGAECSHPSSLHSFTTQRTIMDSGWAKQIPRYATCMCCALNRPTLIFSTSTPTSIASSALLECHGCCENNCFVFGLYMVLIQKRTSGIWVSHPVQCHPPEGVSVCRVWQLISSFLFWLIFCHFDCFFCFLFVYMILIQNCANEIWVSHLVHCHTFHEIRRLQEEGVALYVVWQLISSFFFLGDILLFCLFIWF